MTFAWVIVLKNKKTHPFWNLLHMTAPDDHVQGVMCALNS